MLCADEVEDSEARLSSVAEPFDLRGIGSALPSMIGYWDKNLINRYMTRAYAEWFEPGQAPRSDVRMLDLYGAAMFEMNRPYVEAALRGELASFEWDLPHRDRKIHRALASYIPDMVEGRVQGFYVVAHDISPLVERRFAGEPSAREGREGLRATAG